MTTLPATLPATWPDDAPVWLFVAPAPLPEDAADRIATVIEPFLAQWESHGAPVRAGYAFLHGRALIIAADPTGPSGDPSGCSRDTLGRAIETLSLALRQDLRDRTQVCLAQYPGVAPTPEPHEPLLSHAPIAVHTLPLTQLGRAPLPGPVDSLLLYDLTPTTLGQLRATGWPRPLEGSWAWPRLARALSPVMHDSRPAPITHR